MKFILLQKYRDSESSNLLFNGTRRLIKIKSKIFFFFCINNGENLKAINQIQSPEMYSADNGQDFS